MTATNFLKSLIPLLLIQPILSAPSPLLITPLDSSLSIDVSDSLSGTPAFDMFKTSHVSLAVGTSAKRDTVIPEYIYVLMCTDAGFRGDCEVFGAPPGSCVGFYSFNDTSLEATFDNAVTSLSTNTGGLCQFYLYDGCDANGDDDGHSMSYAYDLANNGTDGYEGVFPLDGYDNAISSWRC